MKVNKENLIKQINRLLPIINVVLFLFISFFIFQFYTNYTKTKEGFINKPIFVINDTVFNKILENKYIQVHNITPLELKLVDNGLYLKKEGEWKLIKEKKEAEAIVVILPEHLYSIFIKGVVLNEKK